MCSPAAHCPSGQSPKSPPCPFHYHWASPRTAQLLLWPTSGILPFWLRTGIARDIRSVICFFLQSTWRSFLSGLSTYSVSHHSTGPLWKDEQRAYEEGKNNDEGVPGIQATLTIIFVPAPEFLPDYSHRLETGQPTDAEEEKEIMKWNTYLMHKNLGSSIVRTYESLRREIIDAILAGMD